MRTSTVKNSALKLQIMSDHSDQNYGKKGIAVMYAVMTLFFIISVILYVYWYNFRLEF